jgi:hypothetical protein
MLHILDKKDKVLSNYEMRAKLTSTANIRSTGNIFGNTQLLKVFQSVNSPIINRLNMKNIDLSSFTQCLPKENSTLNEKILRAEQNKILFVHGATSVDLNILYKKGIFKKDLFELMDICMSTTTNKYDIASVKRTKSSPPGISSIFSLINIVTKQSILTPSIIGPFEIYAIIFDNDIFKVTIITFSSIKTDKIWDLYFIKCGDLYIDMSIKTLKITLLSDIKRQIE